ncbi:MAG: cytochrome C [Acidobacteria bacterium]|nr:MAG: cytochrome C [Acidobacteriota bacterium]REK01292.1 MAG: cytochrome C [Acidobacteriota bacterium]REK14248.1 MAG: cytochrome C [Acidobacteriota bacterium]REK44963.1 MAG: cytochrome C [Acidobacteriota bacterium]
MKTALKVVAALILLAVAGIQFFRPERSNPPVDPTKTLSSSVHVPAEVTAILERSCTDCHSNQTVWPWYSNVAPISWSVAEHVDHGREELNFSEWAAYSEDRKERKLEEICEEVRDRHMPHPQYLWIHRDAVLSKQDIETLCNWTLEASDSVPDRASLVTNDGLQAKAPAIE